MVNLFLVMSGLEGNQHHVANVDGGGDEEDLHDGVVEGDVGEEEVRVPSHKDCDIQCLALERNACTSGTRRTMDEILSMVKTEILSTAGE